MRHRSRTGSYRSRCRTGVAARDAASPQPVLLLVRGFGDGGLDPASAQVGADPAAGRHCAAGRSCSPSRRCPSRRNRSGSRGILGRGPGMVVGSLEKGPLEQAAAAQMMIAGAVALTVCAAVLVSASRRSGAEWASTVACAAWIVGGRTANDARPHRSSDHKARRAYAAMAISSPEDLLGDLYDRSTGGLVLGSPPTPAAHERRRSAP